MYAESSESAYGGADYISEENNSHSIFARARLTPIKQLTLPQLELMAVMLASRNYVYMSKTFQNELKFPVKTI